MDEPQVVDVRYEASRSGRGREWLIYETSDRWQRVVRRFAPEFFPVDQPPQIHSLGAITSDLARRIREHPAPDTRRRIVLWQVDRGNFPLALEAIAATRLYQRGDLQIAAVRNLPRTNQMALLETGVVTLLRHPEQFPGLRHLAQVHFSASHFSSGHFVRATTSQPSDHLSA